jgi:hypothetical protein
MLLIGASIPFLLALVVAPLCVGSHTPLLVPAAFGVFYLLFAAYQGNGRLDRLEIVTGGLWVLYLATIMIPFQRISAEGEMWTLTNPSGVAILWTGRLGVLLLAIGAATVLFFRNLETDARSQSEARPA